jgi:hypothetical protein
VLALDKTKIINPGAVALKQEEIVIAANPSVSLTSSKLI